MTKRELTLFEQWTLDAMRWVRETNDRLTGVDGLDEDYEREVSLEYTSQNGHDCVQLMFMDEVIYDAMDIDWDEPFDVAMADNMLRRELDDSIRNLLLQRDALRKHLKRED